MNMDELNARAEAGDVDAMMQMARNYMDQGKLAEAVTWADKAAETGNLHAIYQAVHAHSVRLPKLVETKFPPFIVIQETKLIRKHISYFFDLSRKGLITLSSEVSSYLLSMQRDADYYESAACFFAEPRDNQGIIQLLKDDETARARFLCAHAYANLGMYGEALEKLEAGYKDKAYCTAGKNYVEQRIFSLAMIMFSGFVRAMGSPDRAVEILNTGLQGVENEMMKGMLREELGKYQKTLGGWKYTE